jgi:hypothetical protein
MTPKVPVIPVATVGAVEPAGTSRGGQKLRHPPVQWKLPPVSDVSSYRVIPDLLTRMLPYTGLLAAFIKLVLCWANAAVARLETSNRKPAPNAKHRVLFTLIFSSYVAELLGKIRSNQNLRKGPDSPR